MENTTEVVDATNGENLIGGVPIDYIINKKPTSDNEMYPGRKHAVSLKRGTADSVPWNYF